MCCPSQSIASVNPLREAENPDRTREFLSRVGLRRAYDDPEGKLLKQLGGEGLPFIVILDGHRSTTNQFEWQVVHRQAGLKGVASIRAIIDKIGKDRPAAGVVARDGTVPPARTGGAATQSAEFAAELLGTDDVHLSSYRISARHAQSRWEGQLTATFQGSDLTYEPDIIIPGLFEPTELSEKYWAAQVAVKGDRCWACRSEPWNQPERGCPHPQRLKPLGRGEGPQRLPGRSGIRHPSSATDVKPAQARLELIGKTEACTSRLAVQINLRHRRTTPRQVLVKRRDGDSSVAIGT